ncbi:MAG: hypothetical protein ABJN35_07290 [Erythrobacter sp.]
MIFSILAFLVMGQSGEPARTVNGDELGPAERFTTEGPATICMRELVIRPNSGDSVQLVYSGIHSGTMRIFLSDGSEIDVVHGDNFRDQRSLLDDPEWVQTGMRIYRANSLGNVRYQFEGSGKEGEAGSHSRGFISGNRLNGSENDRRIIAMVTIEDPNSVECDARYQYGWTVILGEEPYSIRTDEADDGQEN